MTPRILYEDQHLLLVDKPAGWLVHGIYHKGEAKHNEETLVDWLTLRYPEIKYVGDAPAQRGGIVHRLDRETSGVMVVARTQEAFLYLKKLFSAGGGSSAENGERIHKTYVALVWGRMKTDSGTINKPISIIDGSVKRTVFRGKMTREAMTEYRVLSRYRFGEEALTLVEVQPKTGRTHQIRVHFSSIGHAVVGDKLYGKKGSLPGLTRQFLHAKKIEFISPLGKKIVGVSELSDELKMALAELKAE